MNPRKLLSAVLIAVLLLASAATGTAIGSASPWIGQADRLRVDWLIAKKLTVLSGGTVSLGTAQVDATELAANSVDSSEIATNAVTADEIANPTRAVQLPLLSWHDCTTDAGALVGFGEGADALPDYINSATDGLGMTLRFDDTGGAVDTGYVCSQLVVPPDYASGGALVVRAKKDAHTGANTEIVNCRGSINGAALGTVGTTTVTTSTLSAWTCTPTLTGLAAGNALGVELNITSGGTADDIVDVYAVEFTYSATQ